MFSIVVIGLWLTPVCCYTELSKSISELDSESKVSHTAQLSEVETATEKQRTTYSNVIEFEVEFAFVEVEHRIFSELL